MSFQVILDRFAAAVGAHDSPGLAALFAENGCYDDYFFGEHHGRAEIAAMLDRFHVGGEQFCWQFVDPVFADGLGYASYCFSYLSREPESAGRLMMFDGMSRFRIRDGQIVHYAEAFDRGMAFVRLGYPAGTVMKLLDRYGRALDDRPVGRAHLEYRARVRG